MRFRMGVNLGDVIEDGTAIYGDGVNIAARLESLADPGGICISEAVRFAVRGNLDLQYEDIGAQELKNIEEAVQAYRVRNGDGTSGTGRIADAAHTSPSLPFPPPLKPSVAILPFTSMGSDPDQDCLADGIRFGIQATLVQLSGLFLVNASTPNMYRGREVSATTVGAELDVRYVLEGAVQRSGERVRATLQLTDVEAERTIWAERYDRVLKDVFQLQDEITGEVITALNVKLQFGEVARGWFSRLTSPEARACYHRGSSYLYEGNKEDNAADLIRRKAGLTRAGRYAELAQRPAAPNPRRPAMFVAGIDAHATYSVIAIVSNTGQLVHGPVRIHNKEADRLDELLSQYRPLEVVVETSPAWPWLFDRLEGSGIHFVLAHAKRLRVIAESNYKSDEIDAELLARMRLAGLIPEVHPKCIAQREQAVLLRNRARLVRERTRMVNRIHAQIHNVGLHLERGRLLTQDGRQWVRDVAWPLLGEERRLFIDMQWELIDQIVPMIRTLDRRVEHMGQKIPAVALLETVPGIGPYRALLIATETLPIERFHTPAHLVSYAGLAPRSSQSGLRPIRHGSIPAGANRWLRGTFVRAVVTTSRHRSFGPS